MHTWHRRGFLTAGVAAAVAMAGSRTALAEETNKSTPSVRTRGSEGQATDDVSVVQAADAPVAVVVDSKAGAAAVDSTAGAVIAQLGLAYVGYPYVAAGNGPGGFDCSGFTQFVMFNALGIDIGHAVEGQPGAGSWVEWGAWGPGDLIFFQNTYRPGISHVGIYIGDGLFVHAENEGTGVVVTSVYSDYYASRYWGANRLV